jgi:hypothetical protein
MLAAILISGLLISGLGMVLIVYAKSRARFAPAMAGVVMCVYPFFIYDLWKLWGITAALLLPLYLLREKA